MTDTALAIVAVLVIIAVGLAACLGAEIGSEKGIYHWNKEKECHVAATRGATVIHASLRGGLRG